MNHFAAVFKMTTGNTENICISRIFLEISHINSLIIIFFPINHKYNGNSERVPNRKLDLHNTRFHKLE